ncbi:MAG: hypothetical protein Q9207_004360 [Kuettlingeria erythrocarpa]
MASLAKWLFNLRAPYLSTAHLQRPQKTLSEEPRKWYCPGRYHPVRLGDVFAGRYEVLRKLGWGVYSTVWLAKDSVNNRHVALKITTADAYGQYDEHDTYSSEKHVFELEMLKHIQKTDIDHPGRKCVPHLLDHFTHTGPNGEHMCLVSKVTGQSLAHFRAQWDPSTIPVPMVQRVASQVLRALDYLHRSCGIIHTDITPQNILTALPSEVEEVWIQEYLSRWPTPVGISYWDYDYVKTHPIKPLIREASGLNVQLADIGAASWKDKHLTEWIQPNGLRAPEVVIQAPWSESVDIWNLGLIVYELLEARYFIHGGLNTDGQYKLAEHLVEIQGVLGDFPMELIRQGKHSTRYFDEFGMRLHHHLNLLLTSTGRLFKKPDFKVESLKPYLAVSYLSDEGKDDFLDFFQSMIKLLPRERLTAQELLDHPWLNTEYGTRSADSKYAEMPKSSFITQDR